MSTPTHVEYRIAGPPGCGKTTEVSRWVAHAAQTFGSAAPMCASYTKAAAIELASRVSTIDAHQIGTLHAHGYRSLGCPRVVDAELLRDWNDRHPDYTMQGGVGDVDDPLSDEFGVARADAGDSMLSRLDLLRARMIARELWPVSLIDFATRWEAWKREHDAVDFGDMIERPLHDVAVAPGNPTIGFFDEVQDCSRLEWALIRRWAAAMQYVVVVGDCDQSIYEWRGADPRAFIDPPVDDDHLRVLKQSYRVPRAVHALAVEWIEHVDERLPVEYAPRDADGEVIRSRATYHEPQFLLDEVERYIVDGKTVAIIAPCSYQLQPIIRLMRGDGIPFWNPYRTKRGDWNPLQVGRGVSMADRLIAWLGPSIRNDGSAWTIDELKAFAPIVEAASTLNAGAKASIARADEVTYRDLVRWLKPETIMAGGDGDIAWFIAHAMEKKRAGLEYPASIVERRGIDALSAKPQVIVSTIHGIKGGEADVVVVIPDLSRRGYDAWLENEAPTRRLFYVAMTRARETLILLEPGSRMAVPL